MQVDVGLNFWLTQWNWQPTLLFGAALAIILYFYAIGPVREKYFPNETISTSQGVMFLLGVNTIFLSLVSPLDKLGDTYLFSAHMVQHLILTLVGPPLLILGIPGWLIQPVLRNALILRVARFLTHPMIAFLLFNVDFWIWHAPPLYIATLTHEPLHIFEHMTFIALSLIYWWPIFSPVKELPRLSIGGQILYLFLGGMPTVALGAGLTFMQPLYTPYIYAPRVWGMSPALDQQLGGLIMWIPGNIVAIVIASILFIRWMQSQDAKQRAEEARQDALAAEVNLVEVEVVEHP